MGWWSHYVLNLLSLLLLINDVFGIALELTLGEVIKSLLNNLTPNFIEFIEL